MLEKIKKSTLKKYLTFQEMGLCSSKIKKCLTFPEMELFSLIFYIFQEGNFKKSKSSKNKKVNQKKIIFSQAFLIFWENKTFLYFF